MHHEVFLVATFNCVDDLCVAAGAERGNNQCLGLTAGEQGRTMSTRQHAGTDVDRANGIGFATVDTLFAGDDASTYNRLFELADCAPYVFPGRGIVGIANQCSDDIVANCTDAVLAIQLVGYSIGFGNCGGSLGGHLVGETGIGFGRLPFPGLHTHFRGKFGDRLDCILHLLVTVNH